MSKARAPVYGLTLILAVGVLAGTGWALPPAPFNFQVSPSTWPEGGRAAIRVEALGQTGMDKAGEPFDIYIVRIPGWPSPYMYLTPTGVWSPTPTPYRASVSVSAFTGVVAEWREPGPAGEIYVAVGFVRASAEFLNRSNWVFQPLFTTVRVRAPWGSRSRAALVLGALGLVTLAAVVLVFLYPRRLPDPSRVVGARPR